eukprot:CAMPEP_0119333312 /NCGR_PEP_ID=MMETSP1333-20130426/84882_1 /TAXON_ID=418940 /ORGANISM="Scyphosphaera apsteinii, Strain RCC1455" /LENGTH=114 /DNA_ID=CAMNT_0007343353 /DNA_START=123 /DNA_END=463 /DNA_ORIENTATION=+
MAEFCWAFPTQTSKRVEFRDLDPYNHVNNATYFSYFEEARVQKWRQHGDGLHATGIAPVLADVWCHYRKPIGLYDIVQIGMRVENVQPAHSSFEHRYLVWSEKLGSVVAQGGGT